MPALNLNSSWITSTGTGTCPSVPGPEFAFDEKSCPVLFLHGDADGWTAMNSVKVWERLAAMGVQGDLHTFAKREHCFMMSASPGTGSYTWLDRVWEFMNHKGYNDSSETRPSARSSPK